MEGVGALVDVDDEDVSDEGGSESSWGSARGYLVLAAFVLIPVALLIAAVSAVWGVERRRVRVRWWLGWTAATAAAALLLAGSLQRWAVLPLQLHGWLAHKVVGETATDAVEQVHGTARELLDQALNASAFDALVGQLLFGAPVAFLFTAIYVRVRKFQRDRLGQLEGSDYSNHRPVGVLDHLRATRNRTKIRRGDYTNAGANEADGEAAVGIGTYGAPVVLEMHWLKVAALVLGGPRTGKTRLANSISAQQVRVLGGGALIIDFKGGDDIPSYWAQVASEENRSFYHFTLNEKSAGQYRRPHPFAASAPAFYDPLVRGNGDSKTSMLLNSVDRDGDAAAYLRTAEDVMMLAFDIADLTGVSAGRGGLETLARILDPEQLHKQANKLTAESVVAAHPYMRERDARRRVEELQLRVQEMTLKANKDQLLRGAINDSRTLVSKFANSSALGGRLRPGHGLTDTIDLVRAVLRGEIVVFSLPTNDYRTLSVLVATMVLLDLQNTTSTLRKNILDVRRITGDTSDSADTTPWKPFLVQVEELGSAKSPVAAAALLGLLNKSANEGIRPILSSQGWSDFVAVDGTGVWANQVLESVYNIFCFQLGPADDDKVITSFSGQVDKLKPRVKQTINTGGRWRIGARAISMNAGMTDAARETRVPLGALQELLKDDTSDTREFVWVTKTPKLAASHTVPEGPNSWYERLRLVTVKEPPNRHDFFGDPIEVERAEAHRAEVQEALERSVRHNDALSHVLSADASSEIVPAGAEDSLFTTVDAADPWATSPVTSPPVSWAARQSTGQPAPLSAADEEDDWDRDDWDDPDQPEKTWESTNPAVENPTSLIGRNRAPAPVTRTYVPIDATDL